MMAKPPNRDVKTMRGALGLMSGESVLDCGSENFPVSFRGIAMFDSEEKLPTPMPFMAATVKECDEPARSPTMV